MVLPEFELRKIRLRSCFDSQDFPVHGLVVVLLLGNNFEFSLLTAVRLETGNADFSEC